MAAQKFGNTSIDSNIVKEDRKRGRRIGPCAFGEKAMYLNSFFISRRYYVPYEEVARVYKRVAMSEGGFSGRGVFGSMPYFVVVLKDGREKACNFKIEEEVDEAVRFTVSGRPRVRRPERKGRRSWRQDVRPSSPKRRKRPSQGSKETWLILRRSPRSARRSSGASEESVRSTTYPGRPGFLPGHFSLSVRSSRSGASI